jgi:hypothetical protein
MWEDFCQVGRVRRGRNRRRGRRFADQTSFGGVSNMSCRRVSSLVRGLGYRRTRAFESKLAARCPASTVIGWVAT